MKVKVRDKIYNSEKEPVMVIFSEKDKKNIANMHPQANRYCSYPDKTEWTENDHKKIIEWMKIEKIDKNFPGKEITKRKGRTEAGRIATLKDWYAKLDKPCQSMWTDFGEPRCSKQVCCFILNDNFKCPEGRTLKEKEEK